MKVLIIGSGGHARVVADILLAMDGVEPIGFATRDLPSGSGGLLGLPVLGSDEDVAGIEHDGIVVAIGDNRTRKVVSYRLAATGETLVTALHPTAIVAPDAVIEPGCMICPGAIVNTGSRIGAGTILNTGCTVDHDCVIGPNAHIAPGVNLAGNVSVGEGGFVGIGSSVIQGITIGNWTTVGAGAAVISNIADNDMVAGVPAKVISI